MMRCMDSCKALTEDLKAFLTDYPSDNNRQAIIAQIKDQPQ
jgi:hypothetical protein